MRGMSSSRDKLRGEPEVQLQALYIRYAFGLLPEHKGAADNQIFVLPRTSQSGLVMARTREKTRQPPRNRAGNQGGMADIVLILGESGHEAASWANKKPWSHGNLEPHRPHPDPHGCAII